MRTGLLKIYDFLSVYFALPGWQQIIFILKIVSLIVSCLLLIIVIYLIIRLRRNIRTSFEFAVESIAGSGLPKKFLDRQWKPILEKLEKGDENGCKLAVIEADKIFDDLLKRLGYQGEDMGERLKRLTTAQIANLDEVWQAHRLRNQIVHEPDFKLKRSQAQRAVEIYQRALKDLETG